MTREQRIKAVVAGLKRCAARREPPTREEVAADVVDALEFAEEMLGELSPASAPAVPDPVPAPAPPPPEKRSSAILIPGDSEFRSTMDRAEEIIRQPKPAPPSVMNVEEEKEEQWGGNVQALAAAVAAGMPKVISVTVKGRERKVPLQRSFSLMPSSETFSMVKVCYTPEKYGPDMAVSYTFWSWMKMPLPFAEAMDSIERGAYLFYAPRPPEVRNSKPAIDGPIVQDTSAPHDEEKISLADMPRDKPGR